MLPVCICSTSASHASACRTGFVRFGSYKRKYDGAQIPRYRCQGCHKTYSDSTFSSVYREKKPYLKPQIFHLVSGLYSQRRIALTLAVNRKTVIRKFVMIGVKAEKFLPMLNLGREKVKSFEFDDQETFEHTKCKPLSITTVVEKKTRWIIGLRVSSFQAKGKLAKIARKKYGRRKDNRKQKRKELFGEIKDFIEEDAVIESDMNPYYAPDVKEFFPKAKYKTYRSRSARSNGQGELKKGGRDPIFTINHTFAMYRANINRLIRKTWCTTKKPERLGYHLAIYSVFHNLILLKPKERRVVEMQFLLA